VDLHLFRFSLGLPLPTPVLVIPYLLFLFRINGNCRLRLAQKLLHLRVDVFKLARYSQRPDASQVAGFTLG
jgi:hypothetical protein